MYDQPLNSTVLKSASIPKDLGDFYEEMKPFRFSMMKYECVIREIKTKLEVLNSEMSIRNKRNPIKMVQTRIKQPASIIEKLKRRNLPVSVESMEKNLNDIAGLRVICSFIDDIYELSGMLEKQDDVKIIEIKDYFKNPKPNGYRSYHMIVEVPVFFSDHKEFIRAELQIRTIAMDFWASVEHKIYYKKAIDHNTAQITEKLRLCAENINMIAMELENISREIEIQEEQEHSESLRL